MLEFQEKKKLKKVLYSYVSVAVLCIIMFFIAKATWGVYHKAKLSRENKERAGRELAKLEARETMLRAEIARLSSVEGKEQEIRGRFNVVKEGEEVAIIVDALPGKATTSGKAKKGFWSKITGLFR
jgi:cell division protein FtsB